MISISRFFYNKGLDFTNKIQTSKFLMDLSIMLDTIVGALNNPDEFAAAAPTTGTWKVGNRVYNNAPASGQPIGWVCTVAGTPGTWKAWGTIS